MRRALLLRQHLLGASRAFATARHLSSPPQTITTTSASDFFNKNKLPATWAAASLLLWSATKLLSSQDDDDGHHTHSHDQHQQTHTKQPELEHKPAHLSTAAPAKAEVPPAAEARAPSPHELATELPEAPTPASPPVFSRTGEASAFGDGSDLWLVHLSPSGSPRYFKLTDDASEATAPRALGFTSEGSWLLALVCERLVAYPLDVQAPPVVLTPAGTTVGNVFVGDPAGVALIELGELSPGPPAVYRIELPNVRVDGGIDASLLAAASFVRPTLDTCAPAIVDGAAGDGRLMVQRWVVSDEDASVRGAILRNGDETILVLREQLLALKGGEKWQATCERLNLPLPPPDPLAPPVYSGWKVVDKWTDAQVSYLGFREGLAWLQRGPASVRALAADGDSFDLQLAGV